MRVLLAVAVGVSASTHRHLVDKLDDPGQVHSFSMSKSARKASSHDSNKRNLRSTSTGMVGTAASDYKIPVIIGEQTFHAIADTGSADFAVTASANSGCQTYYAGTCDGPEKTANYGSGSWTGNVCEGPSVTFAGLDAGSAPFVGTTQQSGLFHCDTTVEANNNNGIIGMGFSGLSTDNQPTLLDSLFSQNVDVAKVFSMQCCGYNGGEDLGTGNLIIGGVDSSMYTGNFSFTPITEALWYCVDMTDVKYGGQSLAGLSSAGSCETIVDSGTSALQLAPELYDSFMAQLPAKYTPDQCISDELLQSFPDLTITLGGGVELTIPATHYTQPQPLSAIGGLGPVSRGGILAQFFGGSAAAPTPTPAVSNCRSLYVMKAPAPKKGQTTPQNILGQVVMEAYYTVFDQENLRVGFAPIAGCEANPTPGTIETISADCSLPGSNCGEKPSSGFVSNLQRSWKNLGVWRWVIIGAGGVLVLMLIYLLLTPVGTFRSMCHSRQQRPRRPQRPVVTQAAFSNDLRVPLSPAIVASAPPAATGVVPAGWQTIQDPDSGRSYYINPTTGRATWNLPRPAAPGRMHTISLDDEPITSVTQQSNIAQV